MAGIKNPIYMNSDGKDGITGWYTTDNSLPLGMVEIN